MPRRDPGSDARRLHGNSSAPHMLFNSFIFLFGFLPITYAVFWVLRTANQRYIWLTITGYVFYGYWDWRFCLLMLFSTVVSYQAGLGLLRWDANPSRRKLFLVVPITVDLLLLGFFKYANFGLNTAHDVLRLAGVDVHVPQLNIVLPVGISFYTFHTISYIVDAYRRQITPTRNFFEFSAYVSLFSQLVAGPIVRFRQIEADLERIASQDRGALIRPALTLFLIGLVEKILIADTIAAVVDPMLAQHAQLGLTTAWIAMLGYSFQLYFDFTGYSTMAVGLGLLFGLRIPRNFDSPYKALDPSDFWRRWHISLSTCMRDYLYIPFGGNKGGEWYVARNLMLTMLVGGLWHGASVNFILWGLYHGVLLIAYRFNAAWWDRLPAPVRQGVLFLCVLIGWVPFRLPTLTATGDVLAALFGARGAGLVALPPGLIAVPIAAAMWWAFRGPNAFQIDVERRSMARDAALFGVAGAVLALMATDRASPFLYFQF
jgi:alginate O-acetyltransferase complex protein AlgI